MYALLIQEEVQRNMTNGVSTHVESTVLAAKGKKFSSESTSNQKNEGKNRPLCTHCGKLGHTIDKCYRSSRSPQAEPRVCEKCQSSPQEC